MAQKRMFRLDVLETDAFMEMPLTTQALYFWLGLKADDDGFVGNPNTVTRNVGASSDDLKLLIAKRFLIQFADGVVVVKHWRMHNTLSANRYKETKYLSDKSLLLLQENKAYSLNSGTPLDDRRLAEMGKRQIGLDEQKTNNRRTIDEQDEQKTNTDIDIGIDIDLDIDKDLVNNIIDDDDDSVNTCAREREDDEIEAKYREAESTIRHSFLDCVGREPLPTELECISRFAVLWPSGVLVDEAIYRAAARGVKSIAPYVQKILEEWNNAKVTNRKELMEFDKQYGN